MRILKLTQRSTGGGTGVHYYAFGRTIGYFNSIAAAEVAREKHRMLPQQVLQRVTADDYVIEVLADVVETQEAV